VGRFLEAHSSVPGLSGRDVGVETPLEAADEDPAFPDPPVPVPPGVTLDALRVTFESFSIDASPDGALQPYVDEAFCRFLRTWDLVKDCRGRALELGANPYFITMLLSRYTELEITLANYFGPPSAPTLTQTLRFRDVTGGDVEETKTSYLFNMEEDRFPFEDRSFDIVLFCEIVEHLVMDPLAPLREIRRVLEPGGLLVLTTPNVSRIENVVAMVNGGTVSDVYSGYGPYGRHNREYTRSEIERLLEFAGFDISKSFTANSRRPFLSADSTLSAIHHLVAPRMDDLGQYTFIKASSAGYPHQGLPRFLYQSYPEAQLVDFP
jgi:SAM-dependent methyltransferase